MSFPDEAILISRDAIRSNDILIEDRKLVAVGGSEVATRESNTARKSSFYSRLIESLADNIHGKQKTQEAEWNLNTLKHATGRIVDIVVTQSLGRRFIWLRQFPEQQYVLLTREQTINKLANDLQCQMRKLDAKASAQAEEQQNGQPTLIRYGQRLILTVCTASKAGISPYRSALLLDQPPIQPHAPAPSPLACVEAHVVSPDDETFERYKESSQERSLRLQLRHRFLACVRTKKSIFEFSNALLSAWGLPGFGKKGKKIKSVAAGAAAAGRETPNNDHGLPPSLVVVNNSIKDPTKEQGSWRASERKNFLEGFEMHPVGKWKDISPSVPSR